MTHFNKLTPAQAERLAMLAEECGEVIQIIGKILRHGLKNYHPDRPHMPNSELLRRELDDLAAVEGMLVMAGDLLPISDEEVGLAHYRKLRFAHHQEEFSND